MQWVRYGVGCGEVLLGLDNRSLRNSRGCKLSPRILRSCTRRVGTTTKANIRVNVIVNNNGVFHKLANTGGNFSHIGNSRVNVLTAVVGSLTLRSTLRSGNIGTGMLASVHVRPVNRCCSGTHTVRCLRTNCIIVVNNNASGPCFAASSTSTLHNVRVRTSIVLGNAHISNICATSPRGSPATIGFSQVAFRRILSHELGIVSLATFALYHRGKLNVVIFSVSAPNGLNGMLTNRRVKALMAKLS